MNGKIVYTAEVTPKGMNKRIMVFAPKVKNPVYKVFESNDKIYMTISGDPLYINDQGYSFSSIHMETFMMEWVYGCVGDLNSTLLLSNNETADMVYSGCKDFNGVMKIITLFRINEKSTYIEKKENEFCKTCNNKNICTPGLKNICIKDNKFELWTEEDHK